MLILVKRPTHKSYQKFRVYAKSLDGNRENDKGWGATSIECDDCYASVASAIEFGDDHTDYYGNGEDKRNQVCIDCLRRALDALTAFQADES